MFIYITKYNKINRYLSTRPYNFKHKYVIIGFFGFIKNDVIPYLYLFFN